MGWSIIEYNQNDSEYSDASLTVIEKFVVSFVNKRRTRSKKFKFLEIARGIDITVNSVVKNIALDQNLVNIDVVGGRCWDSKFIRSLEI